MILAAPTQNAHIGTTVKKTAEIERVLYDKYGVFPGIPSRAMAFFHFDGICYEFVLRMLVPGRFPYAKPISRLCHGCSPGI